MRCPEESELALWIDGLLSATRAEAIRAHMQECLRCRLVVDAPVAGTCAEASATAQTAPLAEAIDAAARTAIPSFETLKARLSTAFWGGSAQDPFAGDPSFQDDLVLMAADTGASDAVTIPSLHAEDGRLVVTFRVSSEGRVTAFFVSEERERVRFRVLRVGRRCYISDAEGRAVLSGLTADEALGQEIGIPPVVAWVDAPSATASAETRLELLHPSKEVEPARLYVRMEPRADRASWTVSLESPHSERQAFVAIFGDRVACLLPPHSAPGAEDGFVQSYDAELTERVRIQMIDLS